MTAPIPEDIPLSRIKDGGAQMRAEMNVDLINEYAEAMLNGAVFPPIDLFYDGADYWLGEGYHRVEAARKIERETINATQREMRFSMASAPTPHTAYAGRKPIRGAPSRGC